MNDQANITTCLITCPSCQAQYNVAPQTLGENGRRVKCAQCNNDWKAVAEPLEEQSELEIDEKQEEELDSEFEEVENTLESSPATPDAPTKEKVEKAQVSKLTPQEKKDTARRNNLLQRTMPKKKSHLLARILGGVLLAFLLFGGVFLRENIVKLLPDMAGVYANIGLGVNVVGLDFVDIRTLRVLRDGDEVMDISASIKSVSSHQVPVPKILISLLDQNGISVFEWSVTSRAAIMLPGEWIEFETKLISPPAEAVSVRLAFEE